MWDRYSTAIDELASEDIAGNIERAFGVRLSPVLWAEFNTLPYGRVMVRLLELIQVKHESF